MILPASQTSEGAQGADWTMSAAFPIGNLWAAKFSAEFAEVQSKLRAFESYRSLKKISALLQDQRNLFIMYNWFGDAAWHGKESDWMKVNAVHVMSRV
jgi:hypothetical protein